MKMDNYDYVMVFTSHYRALYMYDRLKQKDISVKLVTAPNKINISCTQALKFNENDKDIIEKELRKNNVYPTATFKIIKEGKNETYELIE